MKIQTTDIIGFPLSCVYQTLRDKLCELVPFLPEVKAIRVLERDQAEPGVVRVVNFWQGDSSNVPRVVRPFLKEEHIGWKDHARWIDAEHRVEWRFESLIGDRYFECSGENRFTQVEDAKTRLAISGDLRVFLEKLPGIPRFLARKVAPRIEEYLIDLITPNLVSLARGVEGYLASLERP